MLRYFPYLFRNNLKSLLPLQTRAIFSQRFFSTQRSYQVKHRQFNANRMTQGQQRINFDLKIQTENNNQKSLELNDFQISNQSKNILRKKGIDKLFPIQGKTFNDVYDKKDLIACDRTGSGKTLAFALPTLERLRLSGQLYDENKRIKFVILAPTRELALQITSQIQSLKHSSNQFVIATLYGGAPRSDQKMKLLKNPKVIVATPGRFIDFYENGNISLRDVETLCLDQADYMLDLGFKEAVSFIIQRTLENKKEKPQMLLFSATMPLWIRNIVEMYMTKNHKYVKMFSQHDQKTPSTIKHSKVLYHPEFKTQTVKYLIQTYSNNEQVLIFSKTKSDADMFASTLKMKSVVIHGDFSQSVREIRLKKFKEGSVKILIATDVAARGLDIANVSLIIHLCPPQQIDSYIHRSGRTGRAGKQGTCLTLINKYKQKELITLKKIQQHIKKQLSQIKVTEQDLQNINNLSTKETQSQDNEQMQLKEMENQKYDGYNIFFNLGLNTINRKQFLNILADNGIKQVQERQIRMITSKANSKNYAKLFISDELLMRKILKTKIMDQYDYQFKSRRQVKFTHRTNNSQ